LPIVYDVTHSLQLPGGGKETGGLKQYAAPLARAAAATGSVDGFFLEVHDSPDEALSDRATQLDVEIVPKLIHSILHIRAIVREAEWRRRGCRVSKRSRRPTWRLPDPPQPNSLHPPSRPDRLPEDAPA